MVRAHHASCPGASPRWLLSLADLARLRVELPDLQRGADEQRVTEVPRRARGGDILLALDSFGRRWLVDGQHRFRAALRLSGW